MTSKKQMHKIEAKWYKKESAGKVICRLCPRMCIIAPENHGFCGVRKNIDGTLYALSYGHPVAIHIDPIEKKPLKKFLPGTRTFSIGCYGCNLSCVFCQNYHLSRAFYSEDELCEFIMPEQLVNTALKQNCASIAFTYNEPITWAEYMIDIAKFAKKSNLATVMVSNGYLTEAAAKEIFRLIDAANIDMKGFSEDFYHRLTSASLEPVLNAMKLFFSMGKHLEITNLVIPGENDSKSMIENFLDWTAKNLSMKVPIHFTAYHPDYKYNSAPPTPSETLHSIKSLAEKKGFKNIFLGNIF